MVILPADADNQAMVQVRWITANADGNDEWVGIDDIAIIGDDLGAPTAGAAGNKGKAAKPDRAAQALTKLIRAGQFRPGRDWQI